VPDCATGEPCVLLGDALREISQRLSLSRSSLYNMGMHRELRVHACRPVDARPAGRSVFVPQSAVDEAVDRITHWLPS
jgi:predicted DNA-binding transcriptional regulator AlpA